MLSEAAGSAISAAASSTPVATLAAPAAAKLPSATMTSADLTTSPQGSTPLTAAATATAIKNYFRNMFWHTALLNKTGKIRIYISKLWHDRQNALSLCKLFCSSLRRPLPKIYFVALQINQRVNIGGPKLTLQPI